VEPLPIAAAVLASSVPRLVTGAFEPAIAAAVRASSLAVTPALGGD
jgi:hypothetical protein